MKIATLLLFMLLIVNCDAQEKETQQTQETEVLTLGVFHFNFPNLDKRQIEKSDQIDVLNDKYQKEINLIVEKLSAFKPTIIVIENRPNTQSKIDSVYNLYLQNRYELNRQEEQQIGFRLAKKMGLKKLYCVDEWGDFDSMIEEFLSGKDSIGMSKFLYYYENNPDIDKRFVRNNIYKSQGIIEELKILNDPENIKKDLGNYLIGDFKYENQEGDFLGTKFQTGRWFSRNLKIFRNIQRIPVNSSDRILVIFGAGHMNLLNMFFDCSPEYKLVKTNSYLE